MFIYEGDSFRIKMGFLIVFGNQLSESEMITLHRLKIMSEVALIAHLVVHVFPVTL